jgi:hypothetical protein
MTATDPAERTIPVPGGYLVVVRTVTGGIAIHEYDHVEDPDADEVSEHGGSVYVPGTADVLSAVITELTLLLTDVRRAEAQAAAAKGDGAVAEWLASSADERAAAFLAKADAHPDVDSGVGSGGMSAVTLASVAR